MEASVNDLTHIDARGNVRMVDVSAKSATRRTAVAQGRIAMAPETCRLILTHRVAKGNVLETARIAGILAAKHTAALIPMCHPLNLTHVSVDFDVDEPAATILATARVRVCERTGVEMEALTAVSIALLTIYDMCKAVDRGMRIFDMGLLEKSGGKSGAFRRRSVRDDPVDNIR
jgi:cyclic pyranopterin phosphate synthase